MNDSDAVTTSPFQLAIDGPTGSGKSTLAARVAETMGWARLDTGAMYRAIGYEALRQGRSCKDEAALTALLASLAMTIHFADDGQHVCLNGVDVSGHLRTPDVTMAASDVSTLGVVRAYCVDRQRAFAAGHNVVMDGRDIGTCVLPNATLKIFLTADAEVRAERRQRELIAAGCEISKAKVLADLKRRDAQDASRALSPTRPAADAVRLDSSALSADETLARVLALIEATMKKR